MFGELDGLVREKIDLSQKNPEVSKVMPLGDAIHLLVRPGMHLHLAQAYLRPSAAIYELCRRFWNTDPGFTFSSLGFIANMVLLVYGGLARKIITSFAGDSYPFPGPNRIYQEAYRDGRLEIENWTVLTLPLRLMAGALGVDWMPTFSITGSSMEEENKDNFMTVETPDGGRLGMVRALHPDVTFVHAWAADPAGNVLLAPPYAESIYSLFAAREGVVVTTEKVVDTEFLKGYSHFVKVPSYLVKAVCPAPMGVHPSGAANEGIKCFESYAEDEEFMLELRQACKDDAAIQAWVEEWCLSLPDHDAYLAKLGFPKIWYLKGRAATDSWWSEMASRAPQIRKSADFNSNEMMVVAASRLLRERIKDRGYKTILAGIGASNLAAWQAWYDLRREEYAAELISEVGFYGYTPRPADPFIFSFRNIPTCTMLTDVISVLGSMVGAENNRCIGALGAGQVDRFGNLNSTVIPEFKLFLVGSGGACDVALGAQELVVVCTQSTLRCVDRVSYVTAPGHKVSALVTNMGIFQKLDGSSEFTLTGLLPAPDTADAGELLERLRANCGWELQVAPGLQVEPAPTLEELLNVRIFDPRRYFLED